MSQSRLSTAGCLLAAASLLLVSCSEQGSNRRSANRIRKPGNEPPLAETTRNLEFRGTTSVSEASRTTAVDPIVAPLPESTTNPDEQYREQVVGTWKQYETGVRWLEVRPDGTAVMFIDPDWIAKAIIGNELTVEIEWAIEDGRVVMRSIAGKPESTFKAATALFGTERNRPIVELNDSKFVMLDEKDGEKSTWTRVSASEPLPKALRN